MVVVEARQQRAPGAVDHHVALGPGAPGGEDSCDEAVDDADVDPPTADLDVAQHQRR